MPRTTKAHVYVDEIFISQENYDRILMWSQSEKEINYICLGNGKTIENIVRLSNISRFPKNYCYESENERKVLIKEKKKAGQKILASGHSHPAKYHVQRPSALDVKYIKKGAIELIAFPCANEVKAWKISNNLVSTLNNEIQIILKNEYKNEKQPKEKN